MRISDLLLQGLHEKLGDLGRAELVPREGSFAFLHNEESDTMLEMIDGYLICRLLLAYCLCRP
jgi:hypothetical protein